MPSSSSCRDLLRLMTGSPRFLVKESSSSRLPQRMAKQDELYQEAIDAFGPALERLARGYEADPDKRRDLLQ